MAAGLRTPGTGEEMLAAMDRQSFAALMAAVSPRMEAAAIDEYWRSLATDAGKQAILEMYRSGDFEKLAPHEGALGRLGLPTLILWGENDEFAPVAGAHRFQREIPGSQLEIVADAGHFVFSDAPEVAVPTISRLPHQPLTPGRGHVKGAIERTMFRRHRSGYRSRAGGSSQGPGPSPSGSVRKQIRLQRTRRPFFSCCCGRLVCVRRLRLRASANQ